MSRIIYQHKWMTICADRYDTPFVDVLSDGTMVVALTESGDMLLLSEFSPAYDRQILFLPAGAIDPGEIPEVSANRELQEEAGYKAGRLDYLGVVYPFIKYLRGQIKVYLARDLQSSWLQGDETTEISVEPTPFADFEGLIAAGRLQDSSVIAALYMARSFLAKETMQSRESKL
jgi:8-oxo-dGTP pyrophosphatase MutT (NUDIX family)